MIQMNLKMLKRNLYISSIIVIITTTMIMGTWVRLVSCIDNFVPI